jgi:hypothetical protein
VESLEDLNIANEAMSSPRKIQFILRTKIASADNAAHVKGSARADNYRGYADMDDPTEDEIKKAQEMVQPFRAQINRTPALLSILYDIDLLPEQIRLPINAIRMAAFCILFGKLAPGAVNSLFEKDAQ